MASDVFPVTSPGWGLTNFPVGQAEMIELEGKSRLDNRNEMEVNEIISDKQTSRALTSWRRDGEDEGASQTGGLETCVLAVRLE